MFKMIIIALIVSICVNIMIYISKLISQIWKYKKTYKKMKQDKSTKKMFKFMKKDLTNNNDENVFYFMSENRDKSFCYFYENFGYQKEEDMRVIIECLKKNCLIEDVGKPPPGLISVHKINNKAYYFTSRFKKLLLSDKELI
jgi:hypothetical protein